MMMSHPQNPEYVKPSDMSRNQRQLFDNWLRYIRELKISGTVDPRIATSWNRCRNQFNPEKKTTPNRIDGKTFLDIQATSFDMISVARPVMEEICQNLAQTDTAVVLINNACFILEILGDSYIIDLLAESGLSPGVQISETQIGTNAFALAISESSPNLVTGAEHFLQQYHHITDAATPVFDLMGKPLGALGFFSSSHQHNQHILALSAAGAQSIASQIWNDTLIAEQNSQLAQLSAVLSTISEGVLVQNAEGILLHINSAAEKIFNLSSRILVGRYLHDFFSLPLFLEEAIHRHEELLDVKAKIRTREHTLNLILSLKFVKDNKKLKWIIINLRKETDVLELAQRRFGTFALRSLDNLEGESPSIRRVRHLARQAVSARACVLIRGERGTGKSVLATAIHNESPRRNEPLVIFACSSIPHDLMLLELLGHEQNSSNEAPLERPGKLELALGGTIFFQDIDLLSLEAQAALLNVLELGIMQRLGSSKPISVDVRVMASTAVELDQLIEKGNFRSDLYYRLSSFEIKMPSLRERMEDISALIKTIIKRLSEQFDRSISIDEEAVALMKNYAWPGNLPELESVLGRAASQVSENEMITTEHLPDFIHHPYNLKLDATRFQSIRSLQDMERETLIQSARVCNGKMIRMSEVLGVSRTTLWRKMKQLNIDLKNYRN